jgi:hypothetical protein
MPRRGRDTSLRPKKPGNLVRTSQDIPQIPMKSSQLPKECKFVPFWR